MSSRPPPKPPLASELPPELAGAIVTSQNIPVAKVVEILEEIEPDETPLSLPPEPIAPGPSEDALVVLVVEDDPSIRQMIVRGLATAYTVYEAGDGEEASQILDRIPPPACVVTDVMMPRVDGIALAKRIKSDPHLKWTPFIFLTAKNAPMEVIEGINAGARAYMSKPFKMKELLEKVASLVKGARPG